MWTNDTDSIFTGTERTFADDWASTAQVTPAPAERRDKTHITPSC